MNIAENINIRMVTVQSTVDTGHEDMIHDAQMDFYGTRLATCSSDRSVKIFDVRDGTQTLAADLRGHEGPVWQVAWAHPRFGNILVFPKSTDHDEPLELLINLNSSKIWNIAIHNITGHALAIRRQLWASKSASTNSTKGWIREEGFFTV